MAKIFGINTKMSGKIGDYVFAQSKKHGTIVYEAKANTGEPRRSYKQMSTRTQWSNLGATYKLFDDMLKHGFEEIPTNMSSYNAFVQANLGTVKVYITKKMRKNGGCVLAPYQITEGSMSRIHAGLNEADVLVTNLNLGGLTIDASTTLAAFSEAVIANNNGWEEHDQLSFFHGVQTIDGESGVPHAELYADKVMLDTANPTPLWDITGNLGFTSVDGMLGMSGVLTNGCAAWVHSREAEGGKLKVSTQSFYVENAALAAYQTQSALIASADSYGGINTKRVYLKPDEDTNSVGGGSYANENQNTGGGNTSGGNGTSGTGGGETTTVAAPTFSGETQFTDTTQVSMSAEAGATIHYTTDGTTPTAESSVYSGPVTLTETTTVKAVAVKNGVTSSVTSRIYTKSAGNGGGDNGDTE